MPTVETVRGPVEAAELGTTLMHEHIFILQPEALQNWGHAFGPGYWNEQERLDDAVAKLSAVREVLPALREAGVTQAQIDEMMIANPVRFLTG